MSVLIFVNWNTSYRKKYQNMSFRLLQDAQQTFTVQNKPAAVAPKETITHHFFVSGIGQKKLLMQPKFVAAQKMLLKQKPSKHS